MATLQANSFSSYYLTKEETTSGMLLSVLQKQVIQNQIAELAEQRINLVYDPLAPDKFLAATTYTKGQIDALKYLLECSDITEQEIKSQSEGN